MSDATPRQILDTIASDGRVDAAEVAQLQQSFESDWVIDRAEAELLFEINRRVGSEDNAKEWSQFFVNAITKFVVFDMETPGEVDNAEGNWLAAMLSDPQTETENALLQEIKAKSTSIGGGLADKLFGFES